MAYKDLQVFARHLEKTGPALLFENVKESPCAVLINAMVNYEKMSMAPGVEKFDDIEINGDMKKFVSRRWQKYGA